MNQNNAIGLLLGAIIGGVATFYAIKHQDEIIDKIHDLEDNIHFDRHELIDSAKEKLDQLTNTLHSTIQRYTHSGDNMAEKSNETLEAIMEELNRLRDEVQALKA
jgi:gas vesicle protein